MNVVRRAAAALIGTVLVLSGAFTLVVGIVLFAVFGMDGRSDAGAVRAVAASSALVVDTQRADAGLPDAVGLTTLHIRATAVDRGEIFLGVGPAQDVLAYLSGAPYDIARGVDGRSQQLDQVTVAGTGEPSPPAAQSFWSVQATGTGPQSLTVPLTTSEELVVVMNADAAAPVDARIEVGVDAAWIGPAAIAGIAAGGALLLLGLWLLLAPRRRTGPAPADPVAVQGPTAAEVQEPSSDWGQPIAPNDPAPAPPPPLTESKPEPTPESAAPAVVDLSGTAHVPAPRNPIPADDRELTAAVASQVRGPGHPDRPPREPGA